LIDFEAKTARMHAEASMKSGSRGNRDPPQDDDGRGDVRTSMKGGSRGNRDVVPWPMYLSGSPPQ
jgi:hypothetical protein